MSDPSAGIGLWAIPVGIASGAISNSTPFIFVSLGETLTEKSGRINLGQEGSMVMGAMAAYAIASLTAQNFPGLVGLGPWFGVLAAGAAAAVLGLIHAWLCAQPRVNDVAVGIGIMLFGCGLAFYLGTPFIKATAPQLPSLPLGGWSHYDQIRSALQINWLFIAGLVLAPALAWGLKNTRWGLIVRTVGESTETAQAMGYSVNKVRLLATAGGAFFAGIGGAYLSLFNPGSWSEALSSGQGLMAVALVIFARWQPVNCVWAALLFGGSTAISPALQAAHYNTGHNLLDAAPYVLTLLIMIITCSPKRSLIGAPGELGKSAAA